MTSLKGTTVNIDISRHNAGVLRRIYAAATTATINEHDKLYTMELEFDRRDYPTQDICLLREYVKSSFDTSTSVYVWFAFLKI